MATRPGAVGGAESGMRVHPTSGGDDHQAIDHLARLAAAGSRRSVLQTLGMLAVAVCGGSRSVTAQSRGIVVPGGACASNEECVSQGLGGQPGRCADNGFASDGELNCCGEEGLCCTSDAECCGDLRCAPRGDVCYGCARPPFPMRGLGMPCAVDVECIPYPPNVRCVDGRCASPVYSSPQPRPISDVEAAKSAAATLSKLEATDQFDALYDRMHPDAQAVVPRSAVVGWYTHDFAPRRARTAEGIKVRFLDWTWPVTGKTYAQTADVAYRQSFADGSLVRDEVRLVKGPDGDWRWFFGRDRVFVEDQIARYGN